MSNYIMWNRRNQVGERVGQITPLSVRQRIWKTLSIRTVQQVRNGIYNATGYYYAAGR